MDTDRPPISSTTVGIASHGRQRYVLLSRHVLRMAHSHHTPRCRYRAGHYDRTRRLRWRRICVVFAVGGAV